MCGDYVNCLHKVSMINSIITTCTVPGESKERGGKKKKTNNKSVLASSIQGLFGLWAFVSMSQLWLYDAGLGAVEFKNNIKKKHAPNVL